MSRKNKEFSKNFFEKKTSRNEMKETFVNSKNNFYHYLLKVHILFFKKKNQITRRPWNWKDGHKLWNHNPVAWVSHAYIFTIFPWGLELWMLKKKLAQVSRYVHTIIWQFVVGRQKNAGQLSVSIWAHVSSAADRQLKLAIRSITANNHYHIFSL